MGAGGGEEVDATSHRFFQFFSGMGRAFWQTKLLAAGSSLEHLSMEKCFRLDLLS